MRYRSNNIMALLPPREEGIPILKYAIFFQQSLGMQIFLYRIIDKPSIMERILRAKKTKSDRAQTLQNLREQALKIIPDNLLKHFTYRVKYGKKLPVLLRQSNKGGYEFLIIGKDGTENCLKPNELDKLISHSKIPIMTVSKKYIIPAIKHIVIPVDITQSTKKRLLWATYFAKKYKAKITILSALNMNIDLKDSLAWRNAEKLKHMLLQRGINCEVVILKEIKREKHEVILDYIQKVNPGLVIIRTHQESNMKDTQIGKFVSNLVHNSIIPVFTVTRLQHQMPIDFEI